MNIHVKIFFRFLQIASWPEHVKTAWIYEATQSFIARGVTHSKGLKLDCIDHFPVYNLMQQALVFLVGCQPILVQEYCVTDIVWSRIEHVFLVS